MRTLLLMLLPLVPALASVAACGAADPSGPAQASATSETTGSSTSRACGDGPCGVAPGDEPGTSDQGPCGVDGGPACEESHASTASLGDLDAGSCVDIEATPDELACETTADCAAVVVGEVCPGFVPSVGDKLGTLCPNGAANNAGAKKLGAELLAIPHGEDAGLDFCDAVGGNPRCVAGQCYLCPEFGAGGPAACYDAGGA